MRGIKDTIGERSADEVIDISFNSITKEQRPLTEAQYRDTNYTLNER